MVLHDEMRKADKIYKEIMFDYKESENQGDLFSRYHTKFDCSITRGDYIFNFDYQCNTDYLEPNKKDCIEAILSDARCIDGLSLEAFLEDFGYLNSGEDALRGIKAYKSCKKTARALKKMFTKDELSSLYDWFSE